MTLLEALAAGLPVVASAIGGVPETVGDIGVKFAPGSTDELIEILSRLDDLDVNSLSLQARQRWRSHFSEAVGLRNLERLYADAVG
jgi:glycosyltransferase involved in cell wall biosynthesis